MFLFQPDFSALVRTLTGLGTALTTQTGQNVTLAATSTASFPSGSTTKVAMFTIGVIANAGGTILIQFTDGTNTITVTTVAISTSAVQDTTINMNGSFWQIHNNSASAATYLYAGYVLSQ